MKFFKSPAVGIVVVIIVVSAIFLLYQGSQKNESSAPLVPTETPTVSKPQLSEQEEKEIMSIADAKVKANSTAGLKYSLAIKKHVGNYVRVDVTPAQGEMIDPAQVILEKIDGTWQATDFGTSFPDLYRKVPELFQ